MISRIPLFIYGIENDGIHVSFHARVNGHELSMLVDTGASRTVFDLHRVSGIIAKDPEEMDDNEHLSTGLGTNSMESKVIILDSLQLGEHILRDYPAVLMDLKHVNQAYTSLGLPAIEGVLGGDILHAYHAVIDYKRRVLRLQGRSGSFTGK